MGKIKKFLTALAIGATIYTGNAAKAQTDIHIRGTVSDSITNSVLPNVKVVIIKNSNGERIDSTYTNSIGVYNLDFIWTASRNYDASHNKIYPNPSADQTLIQYNAPRAGNYNLQIFNAQGQQITSQRIHMLQGANTIIVNGGPSGILFFCLLNETISECFKTIRTGENTPVTISTNSIQSTITLKSTTNDRLPGIGDDASLEFTKPSYYSSIEQITIQPVMTINQQLSPIPYTFTTTLKPFLETGEQVSIINPNYSINITWPDGTTNNYVPTDGEIQITKVLYPQDTTALGNAIFTHDTTSYNGNGLQNWMIFRRPKQKTNRPNIAQNEISGGYLEPAYETSVPLDSLNNSTNFLYTIRLKAETQTGQYYYLNSEGSKGLIASSGNGSGASSFLDLSQYTNIDTLDIVLPTFNETTGQQVPQDDLNRRDDLFMMALETRYLPNGDTLMPPHRIYSITSFQDPRWQAIVARDGANSIRSTYRNGTPGVQRAWSNEFTYNGEIRLNYSTALFSVGNANAQIFTENFSAVTGEEEGSGGLAPFVWNGTTSQPSQYAYSISTIPALLNLGTGQQK